MMKPLPVTGHISAEAATAVIDVLLLSIIRAYPDDAKGRENYRRLNEAKSALFGIRSQRGRSMHDDLPELVHMTEAYIRERGKPQIGKDYELDWPDGGDHHTPPTVLARGAMRARQAADPNYQPHSDDKANNLQEKFCRNKDEWLKMSYGQPGMAESVFQLKLRELAELLEPLGVNITIPGDCNSPI
jgi:hypothetical protein